ncbi:hypothetical protein [Marinobacter pelagius]|uniref:Uncharacterized protein n=1 Tax=Marinobacter pelagius TaxID=379482 RepID=A0A1I4QLK0_9GAMM|nr:hypothetical protein [Marinobacter pelagius]SFM40929.1 hypothetical protein SAMN04487961_0163 [Marinobacter pelagius]
MNLYLDPSLAAHRHGRFFVSQLGAEPMDELPGSGLVMMHGKGFQGLSASEQETRWQWASQPGRALLLLPPFQLGAVFDQVDWQITLRTEVASTTDGIVPQILSNETNQNLVGSDGEFDRASGHQWRDYSVNTRYVKKHQGTGIFAATCLPLWSISLLDNAQDTVAWLESLLSLAGNAVVDSSAEPQASSAELKPTDYTLLVCMQAWDIHTVEEVSQALSNGAPSLFTIPEADLVEGFARLREAGLIDHRGLTELGHEVLYESPYGHYAERLKEEAPYERK